MKVLIIAAESEETKRLEQICLQDELVRQVDICNHINAAVINMMNELPDMVILDCDELDSMKMTLEEATSFLQKRFPKMILSLVTSSEQYALTACEIDVLAYIMKPVSPNEVQKMLMRANKQRRKQRVFIRTFDRFDVFVDGEPLYFKNLKAKELLALLVDRRGTTTMELAVNVLWEERYYDENVKQLYRKAVNYLHKLFKEHDLDFFVSNRGSCYVRVGDFECDLYQLYDGDEKALADFNGAYMFEYPWAEPTLVQIQKYVYYWRRKNHEKLGVSPSMPAEIQNIPLYPDIDEEAADEETALAYGKQP